MEYHLRSWWENCIRPDATYMLLMLALHTHRDENLKYNVICIVGTAFLSIQRVSRPKRRSCCRGLVPHRRCTFGMKQARSACQLEIMVNMKAFISTMLAELTRLTWAPKPTAHFLFGSIGTYLAVSGCSPSESLTISCTVAPPWHGYWDWQVTLDRASTASEEWKKQRKEGKYGDINGTTKELRK
jgi:hypothetical protein